MTTMVVSLAWKGLLPSPSPLSHTSFSSSNAHSSTFRSSVPLAIIIIGRDVALSFVGFYLRYTTLSKPVRAPSLPLFVFNST